jgi:hypothetical protein
MNAARARFVSVGEKLREERAMFCPQCGNKQSDELRFCNLCGANLLAVRQAVATREGEEKFDWSKTWMAEMFMSETERMKRLAELERERGVTPEVKRFNEIKAGVITTCVGISLMPFLYVIGMAIYRVQPTDPDVEIIRSIWIAGIIPFMVGIALIINGLFVSKKMVELARRQQQQSEPNTLGAAPERPPLRSADTSEFIPPDYGVTEGTTRHLEQNRER